MLDNDNTISTSVSEVAEKIPTDEMLLYVFHFTQPEHAKC